MVSIDAVYSFGFYAIRRPMMVVTASLLNRWRTKSKGTKKSTDDFGYFLSSQKTPYQLTRLSSYMTSYWCSTMTLSRRQPLASY